MEFNPLEERVKQLLVAARIPFYRNVQGAASDFRIGGRDELDGIHLDCKGSSWSSNGSMNLGEWEADRCIDAWDPVWYAVNGTIDSGPLVVSFRYVDTHPDRRRSREQKEIMVIKGREPLISWAERKLRR